VWWSHMKGLKASEGSCKIQKLTRNLIFYELFKMSDPR